MTTSVQPARCRGTAHKIAHTCFAGGNTTLPSMLHGTPPKAGKLLVGARRKKRSAAFSCTHGNFSASTDERTNPRLLRQIHLQPGAKYKCADALPPLVPSHTTKRNLECSQQRAVRAKVLRQGPIMQVQGAFSPSLPVSARVSTPDDLVDAHASVCAHGAGCTSIR